MKLNTVIFTGATAALLGLVGVTGYGEIQQVIDCVGKDVQIEYLSNYYCGSNSEYSQDKATIKTRLTDDTQLLEEDLAIAQLIIHNDVVAKNQFEQIFLSKFDPQTKLVDGSLFKNNLLGQLALIVETASMNCEGDCNIDIADINNNIYNLLQ